MKRIISLVMLCLIITITKDYFGNTIIRDSESGQKLSCSVDYFGNTICK